ncbi:hypothetical protein BKA70DRAFT_1415790 [Coprinopsis sp. MPI-PUGE-AT-0042]|nr:hypothetical protein BKA70DRAFT_1415790 [Coprinopsis sp. MPI-PUGE-AT-0042]
MRCEGESTSSGKNAGVEATRANLKLAEALPSVSIAVDKTGVFIGNASKPQVPIQHHALDPEATYALDIPLDSLELPQGTVALSQHDYTLASLRSAASIIDRSQTSSNMNRQRQNNDVATQDRYSQTLRTLQAAMGLEEEPVIFSRIRELIRIGGYTNGHQAAAMSALRKLGCRSVRRQNPCPGLSIRATGQSVDKAKHAPGSFERLAWLTQCECPVLRHYESSWPLEALIDIHQHEIHQREQDFRERNGSTATLPDYHAALVDEAVSG